MAQIIVIQGMPSEPDAQSFPFTINFNVRKGVRWDVDDGNAFVTTDNQSRKKWPDGQVFGFSDSSTQSITVEASGAGQIRVVINH
jgi:hypothetical protein